MTNPWIIENMLAYPNLQEEMAVHVKAPKETGT